MDFCGHVANLLAFPELESPSKSLHLTDFIAQPQSSPLVSVAHHVYHLFLNLLCHGAHKVLT